MLAPLIEIVRVRHGHRFNVDRTVSDQPRRLACLKLLDNAASGYFELPVVYNDGRSVAAWVDVNPIAARGEKSECAVRRVDLNSVTAAKLDDGNA